MVLVRKAFFVTPLFFLILASSCTTTKLKSVWKDTTFDDYITTIMVVGVAPRQDVRKFYEKEFVNKFKEVGVEAITSLKAIPSEDQLQPNVILDEVRKRRIEMIMGS